MEPKNIFSTLAVAVTTITAVLLFIADYPKVKHFFFPAKTEISIPLFIISLVAVGLTVFYVTYRFYFKEKTKHLITKTELQNIKVLLLDSERLRLVDFVTGIANQEKFKMDVSNRPNELFHLILIDLDTFGEINKKYGFQKGDEIIRTIAQDLFIRMRRDEEIYKHEYKIEQSFMKRIYRKYTGGDEFIFLIKGPQYEAVGFLTRVKKQLLNLSGHSPVFKDYNINFHGAIVSLYPSDTYEIAYDKLQRAFVQAAEEHDGLSVFWDKSDELNFKNHKYIYDNARKEFKID